MNMSAGVLQKVTTVISKTSCPQQLVIGVVSGWSIGYLTMKLGRPTAFTVGSGIIVFQVVQFTGLVKTDWANVTEKAIETSKKFAVVRNSPKWIAYMKGYARSNTCVAAGFAGGFLIGLAT